jgi:hypothetical protein
VPVAGNLCENARALNGMRPNNFAFASAGTSILVKTHLFADQLIESIDNIRDWRPLLLLTICVATLIFSTGSAPTGLIPIAPAAHLRNVS